MEMEINSSNEKRKKMSDRLVTCIHNGSPSNFQFDNRSKVKIRKRESDCHSRNHNHIHSLTSSPIGSDKSQRFHNANDCSSNGQNVMGTTTTVLSNGLTSFKGNSNIKNNGNPNATASKNSITYHSNHNSSFNRIIYNRGSVCHSNINEMNDSTKDAIPSHKMTSKSKRPTGGCTSTKTTSIFDSIDDNNVGIATTFAFVKPQQLEQPPCVSHEDVTSLAGASSLNIIGYYC
uniref:Uncharacterized protein n=1 Tax=Glossina pallidipes TaxID=7398 RepID=A0A1A9ZA68_GLOPL